ncbi:alpha-mannosidase [Paenibacillus sp. LMG 31459]|uniref:Alpha-mannosidase n=1 Tax=Paenibacillus phytohabitans TaxID=2654978 RepID=A0ABX1YN29_9BACL|nr:alpha-mannosidase [Paenibacillus phytohabitans]NOU82256.1 alpha-mannosidase [Paenibacillus phytohabitans]
MNNIVHVISHTHWDREWYMPFEKHHVRLVALMDELLDVLERDAEFRSFHLDGQTIILDDYLQVRPDRRKELEQRIREGRILIGPWYILQDEFLTSPEANVRNLLAGWQAAKPYGRWTRIGYFPDSFGNIGQAPQLIAQAGMTAAVFGRGVKPTGFNNYTRQSGSYESPYSEMYWESPDGTKVLGILFANWYNNGMEIPVRNEEAAAYWDERIAAAGQYASTPHLLLMNGCDHQPVQADLSAALAAARRLYPDTRFVHSDFESYIEQVRAAAPQKLNIIQGELRSLRSDGWYTLVNTASSRIHLKRQNALGQSELERVAEPLAAFAYLQGDAYPHHLLAYAWKTLMQNHPHDSICGCSVDEVHREMVTRFDKSLQVAESVALDSAESLAGRVDTSCFAAYGNALPFVVFNTSGWPKHGVVTVELETQRLYLAEGKPAELKQRLSSLPFRPGYVITDSGGNLEAQVEDLGVRFGYKLPNDRFREPYYARIIRLTFLAGQIPALGYRTFAWATDTLPAASFPPSSLVTGPRSMENEWIRVDIADNGTFTLLDKASQTTYPGLGYFEDTGDIGNEYVYTAPQGHSALTTEGSPVSSCELVENWAGAAAFEIVHRWAVPAEADSLLQEEIDAMVPFMDRQAQRGKREIPLILRMKVTLERGARSLKLSVHYDNQAKDHRLRICFPAGIQADSHYAESVFEIAERSNIPDPEWVNPSYCHPQQSFSGIDSVEAGLMAAGLGLHEYEVLQDGRNTLAVTLLRAVGELGDWGVFRTPEAQCLGTHTAQLSLIPYSGKPFRTEAAAEAYRQSVPFTVIPTGLKSGELPPTHSWLQWEGDGLLLTSVKVSEETGDLAVRWFNASMQPAVLLLDAPPGGGGVWNKSNIMEERLHRLTQGQDGRVRLPVRPAEIVTAVYERAGQEGLPLA